MKKLAYIDGLKGIGALMVYFCHFVFAFYYAAYSLTPESSHTASQIEIAIGKTPLNLLYSGNAAVCLFLVFLSLIHISPQYPWLFSGCGGAVPVSERLREAGGLDPS